MISLKTVLGISICLTSGLEHCNLLNYPNGTWNQGSGIAAVTSAFVSRTCGSCRFGDLCPLDCEKALSYSNV